MAKKVLKKAQVGTVVDKYKSFVKKGNDNNAFTKKNLKTADSLRDARIPFGRDMEKKRESNNAKADSIEKVVEKRVGVPRRLNLYDNKKMGGMIKHPFIFFHWFTYKHIIVCINKKIRSI